MFCIEANINPVDTNSIPSIMNNMAPSPNSTAMLFALLNNENSRNAQIIPTPIITAPGTQKNSIGLLCDTSPTTSFKTPKPCVKGFLLEVYSKSYRT